MLALGKDWKRKKIANPRVPIGLDDMLRNYRNIKTNPSLKMQGFTKVSWALFGEAIIRIGYEHLLTYEREKGLAVTVKHIIFCGLNTRWANLPRSRYQYVQLNIYLNTVSWEKLRRYQQHINEIVKQTQLKPITWKHFLQALLDIGLWQVENMQTKDATLLILKKVMQFDIEVLAETQAKLETALSTFPD